ncbi:MAG: hypothetical protein OEL69_07620 [Nitrosopumilus sp.]|nr:hypothetical protein [Nitrosopumilus sp.]
MAVTAGTTVFAYFRSIRNKQIENALALNKIHQRAWQIEKAVLMLSKLTAKQTKQVHPEIDTSSLEEVVRELMKDKPRFSHFFHLCFDTIKSSNL